MSSHAFSSCFKSQSRVDSVSKTVFLQRRLLAPIGNTQVGSKLANLRAAAPGKIFPVITGDCNHGKIKGRRKGEADIL